ncbi:methyl-accepting chemotaxis protein [Psychromonas sp. KJ10-10]|uniref:methyl-accepting chemotaxis protein n=1 Tax=Psychromonas sp. KJ10-10 TaxID=3391823 RepID=UPI0039B6034D
MKRLRAGEQGRGFAVVADEVRTLAQRSQSSTVEIKEILEKLQTSAEKTANDMNKSDQQRAVVTEAMETIKNIIGRSGEAIQALATMNVQMANSAKEQSTVASEIAERINGIASLADQIGNTSSDARNQSEGLEHQSKLISQMTDKFTI